MDWMILPLKRYADFNGRSRRREFWMWTLMVVLVSILLSVLDTVLHLGGRLGYVSDIATGPGIDSRVYAGRLHGGLLAHLFMLAVLVPNLAVAARRLHDTDRSGWWLLMPLAPYLLGALLSLSGFVLLSAPFMLAGFVCAIILIVWYCQRGIVGPNRFGADPLAADAPII
jgi:uncharacterized membrane protein YhaH (DUF805 family)